MHRRPRPSMWRPATAAALVALAVAVPPLAGQISLERAMAGLTWREIGPAIMGGRIADLAAVESDPKVFYVGTASGGVWKTTNAGTTFEPIFDDESTASIGDVTVAPSNPNIVWVGTGEPQNRQSSPWGDGVFRSTDGGRSWRHMGLRETRHVGRILIHPTNPDIVYVAAVGHLWGPNPQRGVYKTTDGGATWTLVLFVDDDTGAIDLAMDPGDPNTLFAAMYQRRRTGFGFNGGGSGSGLYRTLDGGISWEELTAGLPEGAKGRIGLDVYRRDGSLVYAVVEADARTGGSGFGGGQGGPRRSGVFRSTDRGSTWEKMSATNPRPMYYSQIRIDPNDPERIYVLGTQLAVSEDGGRTFRNDGAPGIHVDHHALWIDPSDSDHLILGSDGGVSRSYDRGVTWRMYDNLAIGQFYQIGVDMREPYSVCGGLQDNSVWCGPSRTLNEYGIRNGDWHDIWGGDGFYSVPDPTDPTIVYTESQGGNLGRVNVSTGARTRLRPEARPTDPDEDRELRFNWNTPIVVSAHDPATVYVGANVVFKTTDRGRHWEEISPDLTKQIDRAELEIMGVTEADGMMSLHDGISSYGNITTIAESPLDAGLLYAGTDDGNLHVTRDGGATWDDLTARVPGLPERTYVSRVVPSRFAAGTVYATFDGHRNDDYRPYVYVSTDFGRQWRRITDGLPEWSVNVLVEHHRNRDLLFLGNEVGIYVSHDGGASWARLKNNLPTVPVDDIVIHPRDNDLVIGTHGRSIWIMDDITPLERLSGDVLASPVHLFPVRPATMYFTAGGWPFDGGRYRAPNPAAGALLRYHLNAGVAGRDVATDDAAMPAAGGPGAGARAATDDGPPTITILDARGEAVRTMDVSGEPGIHEVVWDLRIDPPYTRDEEDEGGGGGGGGFGGGPEGPKVLPGTYTARLDVGGRTVTTDVEVRFDPRVRLSREDLLARQAALMSVHDLAAPVYDAGRAVRRLTEQVNAARRLVRETEGGSSGLAAAVDSLRDELDALRESIAEAARDTRLQGAIEGSDGPPTADQLWQIDRAWERIPGLIERLNVAITETMPALNRRLDAAGIRPDPGAPVTVPRRGGGGA